MVDLLAKIKVSFKLLLGAYVVLVGVSEVDADGEEIETASNGSITVFGVLSWIAGLIMIIVYCRLDDESNGNSEVLFNSFRAAIIMDMTLFSLGLITIVGLTCATVYKVVFRKNRIRTLCTFIFGLVIMSAATAFYGASAFIGWPYIQGKGHHFYNLKLKVSTISIKLDIIDPKRHMLRGSYQLPGTN